MPNQKELTICSVSYRSEWFIELNWRLIEALNPGAEYEFAVADNEGSQKDKLAQIADNVSVIDGVEYEPDHHFPAGMHHGRSLNKLIKRVDTRYALILDPDFFILRKNWIEEILAHMKENGLAFFGAPYNPKTDQKYRYFPTIMCAFIDLEQVDKNDINFCPGAVNPNLKNKMNKIRKREAGEKFKQNKYLRALRRPIYIGKVPDTGWEFYKQYYKTKLTRECVKPVFKLPRCFYFNPKANLKRRVRDKLRQIFFSPPLLPECCSTVPKQRDYYSEIGFKDQGFYDIMSHKAWEEHMWKDVPFGFHMRKHCRDGVMHDHKQIVDIVNSIAGTSIGYDSAFIQECSSSQES